MTKNAPDLVPHRGFADQSHLTRVFRRVTGEKRIHAR
jgi:hypothetical protein